MARKERASLIQSQLGNLNSVCDRSASCLSRLHIDDVDKLLVATSDIEKRTSAAKNCSPLVANCNSIVAESNCACIEEVKAKSLDLRRARQASVIVKHLED
jgi:hypothetical protein